MAGSGTTGGSRYSPLDNTRTESPASTTPVRNSSAQHDSQLIAEAQLTQGERGDRWVAKQTSGVRCSPLRCPASDLAEQRPNAVARLVRTTTPQPERQDHKGQLSRLRWTIVRSPLPKAQGVQQRANSQDRVPTTTSDCRTRRPLSCEPSSLDQQRAKASGGHRRSRTKVQWRPPPNGEWRTWRPKRTKQRCRRELTSQIRAADPNPKRWLLPRRRPH